MGLYITYVYVYVFMVVFLWPRPLMGFIKGDLNPRRNTRNPYEKEERSAMLTSGPVLRDENTVDVA